MSVDQTQTADDAAPNIIDEVEASAAPLLEHLKELRTRLIWSLVALGVGTMACFAFAQDIFNVIIRPLLEAAQVQRGEDAVFSLIYTAPLELFFVKLKLSMFAGLFLAFPIIAYQVYSFVAPGLYANERGAFWPFLVASPLLFTLGAVFVYFILLPWVSAFSLGQEQLASEGIAAITAQIKVSEYLSLFMAIMFAFGASFQLPVVLILLGKIGIVGSDMLRTGRKYALLAILVFAAIFTPPDFVSQVILTIPVMFLYEVSIWCVVAIERGQVKANEEATNVGKS